MAKTKRKRVRRLPPLDSEEGRLSVERTRQYLTETSGAAYTKPGFIGIPVEHLLWMRVLPGYLEARQSAFDAWMQSEAELPFWREMAHAPDEAARAEIIARHQTNLGLGTPEDVMTELRKHVPVARAYRILAEASRNAENGKPPPEFAYSLIEHAANDIPEEIRSHKELAETWTMLAGRRSSIMRRLLITCWIRGGLWLMEMPDITAFFLTRKASLPEMKNLSAPSADTLRVWKSDLALKSYVGNGRLIYDQAGLPRLDKVLVGEVESTFSSLKDFVEGRNSQFTSARIEKIFAL